MYNILLLALFTQALIACIPSIPFLPSTGFNQHACSTNARPLPSGFVKLKADSGEFLNACLNCGYGSYPDSAAFGTEETWKLEKIGSKVAFRSIKNGNYLSRCHNFWYNGANYPDSVFVFASKGEGAALWTPLSLPNGKYSFQADNGKYLSRSKQGNFAFVDKTDTSDSCIHWEVTESGLPTVTLQADNGQFLRLSPKSGGAYPGFAVSTDNNAEIWGILRIGDKVAFRNSNGNYLSRCNGCWNRGAYPDSAFAHLSTPDEPYSQWKPIQQPNGKWAFQADTGKYLARCNNCACSNTPNLAFVHETNPSNPWAQWTLA